jgi:pyrroloquinoline quinone biosynthesis protein E
MSAPAPAISPPYWLLAELTYQCPLHCAFCYNPMNYDAVRNELTTGEWVRVMREARALGAVQLGFSGGEPLNRPDLEELVAEARRLGFYSNLITSGVGLTEPRIAALKNAGLDHIQLSFQDSTKELNDFLSSTKTFDLKQKVARLIKQYDYPMVMNCVLHRYNLPHVGKIIEMALALGAEYLELANTQYYGWAMKNRAQLMPTLEQVREAERVVGEYREKIGDACKLLFVVPDYFENRPKACMSGWGAVFLGVAPDGVALPCHNARDLPGLNLPNVREMALGEIWRDSHAFNAFRGNDWMQEPCRSCDEKARDLGGCRCQAFMLAGDAAATDPVCSKSPHRDQVDQVIKFASMPGTQPGGGQVIEQPIVFRTNANSRSLTAPDLAR